MPARHLLSCACLQINCSYFSAVGNHDDWYLLSRAIQFFTPGIPLVYYVGLLAGANDIDLVEATKNGRDINRHAYGLEEAIDETDRPVVRVSRPSPPSRYQTLCSLLFRLVHSRKGHDTKQVRV